MPPETHRVQITVSESCVFSYDPSSSTRVRPQDTVEWSCNWDEFEIEFEENHKPTPNAKYEAPPQPIDARIRPNAAKDTYKYTVTAKSGGTTCTDDPDIIVF